VSLSGLLLSAAPGLPSAPRDALSTLVPVIPTTLRTFARDDEISGFIRIYQRTKAAAAEARVAVRIVDARDQAIFNYDDVVAASRFGPSHAADYQFAVPVERLAAGQYLLTCEVSAAGRTVRRDVRFTMK